MREITINKKMSDEEAEKFAGTKIDESICDTIVKGESVKVLRADNNKPLLILLKNVIPPSVIKRAYESIKDAASETDNRGVAAGWDLQAVLNKVKEEGALGYVRRGPYRYSMIKVDGSISRTTRAVTVKSGLMGYFDRDVRFPYCRQTAYTQKNIDKFKNFQKYIQTVDECYREYAEEYYLKQKAVADKTSQDFVIRGTSFTTVTINKNFQTAVHKDAGDFKEGFGNLTVIRVGNYTGGVTVFPQFGIGADIQTGDVLLMDVHEWHGNTPIVGKGKFERISTVMYYRENMIKCGSAKEELERVLKQKDLKL